jgi:hypothetical protein
MFSVELKGYERFLVIKEHLAWLNGRWPSEAIKALEQDVRGGDSPIAQWTREHSAEIARKLAASQRRYRNTKHENTPDDFPKLEDPC